MKMSTSIPGCVFDHYGKVPENIYLTDSFNSPLEEAVHKNDCDKYQNLSKTETQVSVRLKIGKMSCIEYASMMGYANMLHLLLHSSANAEMLRKYFELDDVVERAYLISKNKTLFFEQEALAEANRYEAALYTAVEYNQPECVEVMLKYLGGREPSRQMFYTKDTNTESLSAKELAEVRGHSKCYELLLNRFPPNSAGKSRTRLTTL